MLPKRVLLSFCLALYVAIAASAEIAINDGGTWRVPQQIEVNDAGTWRTIQQVYVNDSGTWRTVFQYLTAYLENDTYVRSGTSPASFRVAADGNIYAPIAGSDLQLQYAWLVAGTNADFEVQVNATVGSFSTGTTGTWLAMTGDNTWTRQCGAGTTQTVTFTIDIRRASDASNAASATVDLVCDRS
jgi:hypothetical protein